MADKEKYPWGKRLSRGAPLEEFDLGWRVRHLRQVIETDQGNISTGQYAFLGKRDKILSTNVEATQRPIQNHEALDMFQQYLGEAGGKVIAAGSLRDDRLVWFLGEVPHGFTALTRSVDTISGHVLFTNYHEAGRVPDIRFMPIRIESFTTLGMELIHECSNMEIIPGMIDHAVKRGVNHWHNLVAHLKLSECSPDRFAKFAVEMFPMSGIGKARWDTSIPAQTTISTYHELRCDPTWWGAYVAVCHSIDYDLGRSIPTRLDSAWYGINQKKKITALKLILKKIKSTHKSEIDLVK